MHRLDKWFWLIEVCKDISGSFKINVNKRFSRETYLIGKFCCILMVQEAISMVFRLSSRKSVSISRNKGKNPHSKISKTIVLHVSTIFWKQKSKRLAYKRKASLCRTQEIIFARDHTNLDHIGIHYSATIRTFFPVIST